MQAPLYASKKTLYNSQIMRDLLAIQKEFQNALLDAKLNAPDFILSTKKVSAQERFTVYSRAYRRRLVRALEDNYSILARHLGEESFSKLALSYVENYPSKYRNIRWFGDKLSDFLLQTEQYAKNEFIMEFAKVEWIFSLVSDSSDAPILGFSDFASIVPETWPNLILKMHPSVHRFNLRYIDLNWNKIEIWEAFIRNQESAFDPVKLEKPRAWIGWRKNLEISFYAMPPLEAQIFDLAASGKTCQELYDSFPNFIEALLKKWLEEGLISQYLIKH